jgi:hypothetical protein
VSASNAMRLRTSPGGRDGISEDCRTRRRPLRNLRTFLPIPCPILPFRPIPTFRQTFHLSP